MRLIVLISLFLNFPAWAEQIEKSGKRPLSLTLSGGVSLAAYEAGFIYYLSQHLQDSERSSLKIVTGTSAGSMNSVISVINACQTQASSPQKSVNWQVWVPLGIDDIIDPNQVTPISLFSRKGVGKYAKIAQNAFMAGLRKDCDVVVGMAVTRKELVKIEIRPGLTTDRHNEFFLFKIKGLGPGVPPLIENFPLKEAGQKQLFLPFGKDPQENYNLLEGVFFASAQFPLAFPPYPLTYCDLESTSPKTACTKDKTVTSDFIDGGIFNNTPVSLASIIAQRFFTKKEREDLLYSVVTLDGNTHPKPSNTEKKDESLLNYVMGLGWQSVETARNHSVSELYANKNGILKQTVSNDKLLPRSSQYYFAFSGFIDRGFREYDFYLGMFEARHFLERFAKAPGTKPEAREVLKNLVAKEYKHLDEAEWQPYFCFLETYDQDEKAKGACEKVKGLKNFTMLMEVNADIVKNRCDTLKKEASKFKSCNMVEHLKSHESFDKDESDQAFFYRRLEELNYPYEHSKRKHASGEDILRTKLEPSFKQLIKKQPKKQRFVIGEGLNILLDTLDFKPQESYWRAGLGSHLQGSYGRMIFSANRGPWIFIDAGVMMRGVDTYVNSNPDELAVAPFGGIAVNFTPKTRFLLQPEVGVRGGYSYAFDENKEICNASGTYQSALSCRAAFIQPHISVGFLDRIRLEMGTLIYFNEHHKNDFTLMGIVQF